MNILIESGYTIRAYLEGDWGKHWRHMLEMPKGPSATLIPKGTFSRPKKTWKAINV